MKITPFKLERYFAKYEFSTRYLLSCSDCEPLSMEELVQMADNKSKQLWETLKLGYTESAGHPLLREAIAKQYSSIDVDDILTVVPEEGIFLFMNALLEPGDHMLCTFPGYQSLYAVADSIGCQVSAWEPDEAQGWRFELAQLEKKLRPNTRLVVVNFPHNPTGYLPLRKPYEDLIRLVAQKGITLLSDEMYRFLEIEAGTTLPSACDLYENAVSLSGLSKAFGLPGLRIGWMVSKNQEIISRMSVLKDYTTICASAPSEILGIIALDNMKQIIDQQLARIRRNLSVLDSFFSAHDNWFAWARPSAGSICFPQLLAPEGADAFCEDLVNSAGIMLVPSSTFNFGNRHVRVGFGRQDLPEVLERFADYLKNL